MTFTVSDALRVVEKFDAGSDGLARKSKELSLGLLRHTSAPFSRDQFKPGHLTCTALVFHPDRRRVLLMHHHKHLRWLLPGGHIEKTDESLAIAAAREAKEETNVEIDPAFPPFLAGLDVHGIAAKRAEPFHLHHDLIWCFRAKSQEIEETAEAPQVLWAAQSDWNRLNVADSIRESIRRAG